MKFKFIRNFIDKICNIEKLEELQQNYQKDLFDLYLSINADKKYPFKKMDSFNGLAVIDGKESIIKSRNNFFPNLNLVKSNKTNLYGADYYFIKGGAYTKSRFDIVKNALFYNKPIYTLELGFLYSATTFVDYSADERFRNSVSLFIDSVVPYYDARFQSNLERMINDKTIVVTEEQKQRARRCIDKIVETHLTKYNHQPIYEPKIGREGVKKVLVVDQSYGDMSIAKGWGSDYTFEKMLQAAIDENPDADIIVKTHPDTMTGKRGGYYTGLKPHDNIYTQTEPINPISLIKYVDKVYVCTTQFGFEALMCGKEVHTFGMPFYANWGLTHDLLKCERRTNKRSLEEIFYLAYIEYSNYINPEKKCRCEIEEAMDYLLKLREEYWETKNRQN